MYSTTSSSHRNFRKASFRSNSVTRSKSSSTTTKLISSSSRSTSTNRSSHTPLAALADKFDRFKKRMSSSAKKDRALRSYDEKKHKSNNSNSSNINALPTLKSKPMPEKFGMRKKGSSANLNANSNDNVNAIPNSRYTNGNDQGMVVNGAGGNGTEAMYNQVVDGFNKMSSSSRDDATTVTLTSTQPSYSLDDGSTIVSEDTTYSHHTFPAGKEQFTVDKKYSMIRTVGSGAYGVVISAKDFSRGKDVGIKMIPRAFHDEIDAKRILREIKLLKFFRHENIISIVDMMPPLARNVEDFNDVYIVTDLMETDLHRIIYSKQSLSIDHVQYFLYQVLRALKYMHSANVLHRDLKPSNLLVNSNCDLKVCDFGLARGITNTHDDNLEAGNGGSMLLTEYVVTRWYRAPEIMLACHEYSKPSDMWSVGCIFAELLGRKPYFPGDDYIDQVSEKRES
jgi:hypothetical protein